MSRQYRTVQPKTDQDITGHTSTGQCGPWQTSTDQDRPVQTSTDQYRPVQTSTDQNRLVQTSATYTPTDLWSMEIPSLTLSHQGFHSNSLTYTWREKHTFEQRRYRTYWIGEHILQTHKYTKTHVRTQTNKQTHYVIAGTTSFQCEWNAGACLLFLWWVSSSFCWGGEQRLSKWIIHAQKSGINNLDKTGWWCVCAWLCVCVVCVRVCLSVHVFVGEFCCTNW